MACDSHFFETAVPESAVTPHQATYVLCLLSFRANCC
jgi:hypothetical protein